MKRKIFFAAVIAFMLFSLTGCIPGDGTYTADKPAGFLWGIWHGWISPISLIVGLFDNNIKIYEVSNTGWWYDFGFYIAIISGFGSLSLSRRKRSKKNND
ncbi:hypothetical protein LY28_03307 [Ruminiclostridium sufflavum DSM 19573]|uniref:Lipoprotein n=1 Tax=Ruminiclostridium sufflavum DSM 19573 TaxID=1121337 RepID=A0A318XGQ5_9FIRM|nr:hypothetical protein [Ruminiclostridium sufflavum]PYG85619.1 hypothetical protein LY28_03307 [Ruminiclostridium sufflavum DSM 19573]